MIEKTQAIPDVRKGYLKKLRFLKRTLECSMGGIHEANKIQVEYAPTLTHRGDGFTKVMTPAKYLQPAR